LQQGGAQAIEDAYVLGDILAKQPEKNIAEIIDQFIERRQKRVQWIMEQSDRRIKALSADEVAARDAAIKEKGAPNVTAFKIFMRENP
jgi:2-polyprenyl-6-methoxyphenol hydroxylase-like FAD-dependent oxidoreductase